MDAASMGHPIIFPLKKLSYVIIVRKWAIRDEHARETQNLVILKVVVVILKSKVLAVMSTPNPTDHC